MTFLVIVSMTFALNPASAGVGNYDPALFLVALTIALSVALQMFWWRPNGKRRLGYAAWIEREHAQELAEGWHDDPTHRHRVRYMHRAKWTKWVADDGEPFVDRGAMAADFRGAPTKRPRLALPLLLGFVSSAVLGAGLIVIAAMFPHRAAWGILSADNTHAFGLGAWIAGVVIVAIAVAAVLRQAPARLEVSPVDIADTSPTSLDRLRAFGHSFTPTFAVAAVAAWSTWIQNWPTMPFARALPFVALAALVGLALLAAICAAKVAEAERRGRSVLRSRGLVPALRGAFVAPSD